jgi:hypothetical protein
VGVGLRDRQTRIRDGRKARAVVVGAPRYLDSGDGRPSIGSSRVNVGLRLAVRLDGSPPYAVDVTCRVPVDKRPFQGEILPVVVDRADPQRVAVDWESCPTLDERADRLIDRSREHDR